MKEQILSVFAIALVLLLATAALAKENVVFRFNNTNGASPQGALITDGKGNFFGTSSSGGAKNCSSNCPGLVFQLSSAGVLTVIHVFSGPDGLNPDGTLIRDSKGNLYGTTISGGASQSGVVFELSPQGNGTWTETVLHSFSGNPDGTEPRGAIALDAKGNLYGATSGGGGNTEGIVYELSPQGDGTWTESILHTFGATGDNGLPIGGVTLDNAGNIFGTTAYGGRDREGEVYELVPNGSGQWSERILYGFSGFSDGSDPMTPVTLDAAGNIYGSTQGGGYLYDVGGTVFELTRDARGFWIDNVLQAFAGGTDGYLPSAVAFDAAGNLYGTTVYGGTGCYVATYGGCGIVFKLTPQVSPPWKETVLYNFQSAMDGSQPLAGVLLDNANHRLYGTTNHGGSRLGYGTIFVIQP